MKLKGKPFSILKGVSDWIASYVVVLVIPMAICSVFFVYSFMVTWEETRNLNASALQLISEELDEVFESAFALEYSIQNNYSITSVRNLDRNMPVSDNIKLRTANREMGNYQVWDNAISTCTIFLPKLEIWMDGLYSNIAGSYGKKAADYGMSAEAFREMLHTKHAEKIFFQNVANQSVCYISSYPVFGRQLNMNIIVELDGSHIQQIFSSLDNMADSGIMIVDRDNQILAGRNIGDIDVRNIELPKGQNAEYQTMEINGRKMLVSCIESRYMGMTYVAMIPYTAFWHRALESLLVFGLALLACTVLGLTAAWFFAKLKQSTYGQLLCFLRERLGIQESGKAGLKEKEIASAISDLVTEYENMQEQLNSADEGKKELILTSILQGRIRSEDIERILQVNAVEFALGNYCLLLLRSRQYGSIFDKAKEQELPEELEKMAEAVAFLVKEADDLGIACEILRAAESIVCICDFGEQAVQECRAELVHLTDTARKGLGSLEGHITISVSELHSQLYSLYNAYTEALRVMEYQMADRQSTGMVMNYSEMLDSSQKYYVFTVEDEVELIGLLKLGKGEDASRKVNALYEKNIQVFKGNLELVKCLIMNLAGCILQVENSMKNSEELPDTAIWIRELLATVSVYEGIGLINHRISQISEIVAATRANRDVDFVAQIQTYVQEHYRNENLGNSEIADCFGISSGYLSTFFKENTGEKLLDYIHRVRVEKARELLVYSDLNVEQISNAVGCNSLTLRRLFKKYEGISPIQYREQHKKTALWTWMGGNKVKEYDVIILGATFTAAGLLSVYGDRALVIERRPQAGYEFFNAMKFGGGADCAMQTSQARNLQEAFRRKGAYAAGRNNLFDCAGTFYGRLEGKNILLQMEILSVEKEDGRFAVTAHGVSGHHTYYAAQVIDTRTQQEWVCRRSLNVLVSRERSAEFQMPGILRQSSWGYESNEVLCCELSVGADYIEARQAVAALLEQLPEGYTSVYVADCFDDTVEQAAVREEEGIVYLPSCAFASALEAYDAGAGYAVGSKTDPENELKRNGVS